MRAFSSIDMRKVVKLNKSGICNVCNNYSDDLYYVALADDNMCKECMDDFCDTIHDDYLTDDDLAFEAYNYKWKNFI
jgi:hypothetical protein